MKTLTMDTPTDLSAIKLDLIIRNCRIVSDFPFEAILKPADNKR